MTGTAGVLGASRKGRVGAGGRELGMYRCSDEGKLGCAGVMEWSWEAGDSEGAERKG